MWHALRTELAYFRPWLFGGFGIAVGVSILFSLLIQIDDGPPDFVAVGIRSMFLIMAPMIVGFIVQTYRTEERRARLLLAGPLTPLQLAGVAVLLPIVLSGLGVLASALVLAGGSLVMGQFEFESVHIVGYVGGMMFMMLLLGLLIQESTAAYRQRRLRAAVIGWGGFVVAVLFLTAVGGAVVVLQGPNSWPTLHTGNLIVAVTAMVTTVALYTGRTDFTR